MVTRHQDILDALAGKVPMSNRRLSAASLEVIPMAEWPTRLPNMMKYAPFHITNMDPPNHTRLRKLMTRAFDKKVVESLRPYVRQRAEELVATLRGRDSVDFPQEIARVLEIMRYTAMSAAQNRGVGEDFEWHGKQPKKGDVVYLMFAAGNRDPRVYEDADKLDLTRNNDNSLTFGPGIHHCVGHLLAKMQLVEFFTVLTQRFDAAEILEEELAFSPIVVFRSIPSMRMRFS